MPWTSRIGAAPAPLTPEGAFCYGDFTLDRARGRLICIREDHTVAGREAVTTLVGIPLDGGATHVLASGEDFYSTPRLSPDGASLCWLSWRHPRMPWDGTELWVAHLGSEGGLGPATLVAGGAEESIYQPGWLPDGSLHLCQRSRRLVAAVSRGRRRSPPSRRCCRTPPADAEFGRPQWVLGTATWASAGADRLVVSFTRNGRWHLGLVDAASGSLTAIAPDLQPDEWLAASPSQVVLVAGQSRAADAVVAVPLDGGEPSTLKRASDVSLEPASVSVAEPIEFSTAGGRTAYAFYYAPRNATYRAAPQSAPRSS